MSRLTLDPQKAEPPTRDHSQFPENLPSGVSNRTDSVSIGDQNANLFFVGNATVVIEWAGVRILTDPNFLHAGDHVHLGPGVSAQRLKNPAIDIHELPRIDMVLLSHYHEDHFDKLVEDTLRRSLPIVTTPHAKGCLRDDRKEEHERFTNVFALQAFESMFVDIMKSAGDERASPAVKVTAMPGKHVPPGALSTLNDIVKAVSKPCQSYYCTIDLKLQIPPTNGWMVDLGYKKVEDDSSFTCGYRCASLHSISSAAINHVQDLHLWRHSYGK
jgi:hypothetical protein